MRFSKLLIYSELQIVLRTKVHRTICNALILAHFQKRRHFTTFVPMLKRLLMVLVSLALIVAGGIAGSCRLLPNTGEKNHQTITKDQHIIDTNATTIENNNPAGSFRIEEIPDDVFDCMQGRSFNEPAPVTREDLRLLTVLYTDFEGCTQKGQIICNKKIADDLIDIFRELYENAYPIESIRLIDEFDGDDKASMRADNTSCFNVRPKSSSRSGFSSHAYGMAIDINPLYNPYVRTRDGVTRIEPEEAAPYVDRQKDFPHKIDSQDLCCRLFRAHGFTWGGAWRSVKDYQHFEKNNN